MECFSLYKVKKGCVVKFCILYKTQWNKPEARRHHIDLYIYFYIQGHTGWPSYIS